MGTLMMPESGVEWTENRYYQVIAATYIKR
jgi:hypothetical protein